MTNVNVRFASGETLGSVVQLQFRVVHITEGPTVTCACGSISVFALIVLIVGSKIAHSCP